MKKLVTTAEGGYPFSMDFLGLIQDELHTAHSSLFNSESFIVSGCNVTIVSGGIINISAGIVVINGEYLRFDGVTNLNTTTANYVMKKATTPTLSEPTVFESGSTVSIHSEYKAVIVIATEEEFSDIGGSEV